jgi:hypothetical protein
MLGIIPVCGELIWSTDKKSVALNGKSFCGLEPRLESLIREFLTGTIEQAVPDFGGAQRHDALP